MSISRNDVENKESYRKLYNFKIPYLSTFDKRDYLKQRSRFLAVFCCFCLGILFKFVFTLFVITLENFYFPIKRKQGVNNCFKPLILSAFTTVASRLKSKQKENEK